MKTLEKTVNDLAARLAAAEGRIAQLETASRPSYYYSMPWVPKNTPADCGCPPNSLCGNAACPRRPVTNC